MENDQAIEVADSGAGPVHLVQLAVGETVVPQVQAMCFTVGHGLADLRREL